MLSTFNSILCLLLLVVTLNPLAPAYEKAARSLASSHSAGSRIPTRRRDVRAEASLSSLVSARYPESAGNAGALSVAEAVDAFEQRVELLRGVRGLG